MKPDIIIKGGNRFINDNEKYIDVNATLYVPLAIPKDFADRNPELVEAYRVFITNAFNSLKDSFDEKFNFEFEDDFTFILEHPNGRKHKKDVDDSEIPESYYCFKCDRNHNSGTKIFDKHLLQTSL